MRQLAKAIPTQSREATGVLVQRLDPEDSIVGVTVVPAALVAEGETSARNRRSPALYP